MSSLYLQAVKPRLGTHLVEDSILEGVPRTQRGGMFPTPRFYPGEGKRNFPNSQCTKQGVRVLDDDGVYRPRRARLWLPLFNCAMSDQWISSPLVPHLQVVGWRVMVVVRLLGVLPPPQPVTALILHHLPGLLQPFP